ncbi:MAG: host attachment protein [candidate division KSB1 bacterium]|nr:host attachment protein [candidate division KSB1 bacterium]MDZ7287753.1 host attachment protein [candidate division KSB1 bacterium]MDZ7299907.1 host attachment protein [candidate division KSB1 bacterium]MDZ7308367.1 host attachment protein [candidate division KSB1 bacterium]MDZ7350906.1 host attachment protein [candidate division KSB1 bacterium]
MKIKSEMEALLQYQPDPDHPVLSVYLQQDRSRGREAVPQMLLELKQHLRRVEQRLAKEAVSGFHDNVSRVWRFWEEHQLFRQSLALFSNTARGFWREYQFNVPLRSGVWWEPAPHLSPLAEVLHEYERFGVILTNRTHSRLFTVFLGEIEEAREAFAAAEVRHIKTPARDQLRSQPANQRHADMHALWHLKNVADQMDRLAAQSAFDRLVLAGPPEVTGELRRLLPKRLRSRVIALLHLPVTASQQQVLEETLRIERDIDTASKREMITELVTAAAKQNHAVLGLAATLHALQEGRVWHLIYAEGFTAAGRACPNCAGLFADQQESCGYCGTTLRPVDDLIERMVERLLAAGGMVERVRSGIAQELQAAGGIGAFLRF